MASSSPENTPTPIPADSRLRGPATRSRGRWPARTGTPAAEELRPTVILLDLVMPTIDGLTLLSFFRANEATRRVLEAHVR